MTDKNLLELEKKLSLLNVSVSKDKSKADNQGVGHKSKPEASYNLKFKKELDATKFTIFVPVTECGYFGWTATNASNQSLSKIRSAEEITPHIDIDQKPKQIRPLSQLTLPRPFDMSLPPNEYLSRYPYSQYEIASLYVASKHRNVDLNEMNFIFGGSTLEMLAKQDASSPYMVCRVPTTANTLLVRKCKEYVQNLADVGFQFEGFVTTGSMRSNQSKTSNSVEFVEHMHIMDVGTKYKVLISAESDAVDSDDNPLEVTTSNSRYWDTKVMFQMISVGSPSICCGIKGRNSLNKIVIRSLSDVAADALQNRSYTTLEGNILNGMKALQDQMVDAKYDETYKISFSSSGELSLQRAVTRNAIMLPSEDVVKELLLLPASKVRD